MARLLLIAAALAGCTSTASSEPEAPPPQKTVEPDPAPPAGPTFSSAEYTAHIQKLRARLRARKLGHLNVRIEDPFVVAGDGTPDELERSSGTVRWAADKLEQAFFA